ncbi:MAG: hypothetical protein FJW95_14240, partial [Actinobacteria bacterium]|nr:hypothetical protein [Actinomycetota bacterium]
MPVPARRRAATARSLVVVVALVATVVLPPSPAGAAKAGVCRRPPLTVTLLPGPIGTTGPTEFAVTDAVTRRVAIVPRPAGPARDAAELDQLRAKAARTDLALFTMYLA